MVLAEMPSASPLDPRIFFLVIVYDELLFRGPSLENHQESEVPRESPAGRGGLDTTSALRRAVQGQVHRSQTAFFEGACDLLELSHPCPPAFQNALEV